MKEFRYQMSFDPYNAFYISLIAGPEDLRFWKEELKMGRDDIQSKELFFKTLLVNFDEKAYLTLRRYNEIYIGELL